MPVMSKHKEEWASADPRTTDHLRVLLVEDSVFDADLVTARLASSGLDIDISRVDDASGLRSTLRAAPWDLILVDYTLPGFSGPAAIAICSDLAPEIPCIVVTGTLSLEQATDSMRAGVVDCFVKDNIDGLSQAIRREVESARRTLEHRRREAALLAENRRLQDKHETEAMEADRLLRESEALLRAVIDSAPVEIAVFDRDGRVAYMGGKGLEAFGAPDLDRDELTGALDQPALDELETACAQAFEGNSPIRTFKLADTRREWEVRFGPVRDLDGVVTSVVAVAVDVTERPARAGRVEAAAHRRPSVETVPASVKVAVSALAAAS
jgi:PAS domain S-box-containing protein